MKTTIEKFDSSGHGIAVRKIDNGKEKDLLLLHGFGDSKETFIFIEEFLCKHFNIVGFDFRGHGDSEWKKDGLYNYAENLIDMHNVAGKYLGEKFSILGHSLGGGLAARYAGLFPEKLDMLFCIEGFSGIIPVARERERMRGWLDKSREKSNRGSSDLKQKTFRSMEEASLRLGILYSQLPKEKVDILAGNLVRETEKGQFVWKNDPATKNGTAIPFPPEISRALWKSIDSPVFIAFGKNTHLRANNLEEVLTHFKNLDYREIEGAGHNIHHDQPELLITAMQECLSKNGFA
ncbi:MAG: alpha/beta hydrolase [Leptospira sp.]|nr:alpha/beta hydrolase [Leptospira sp.]